MSFVLNETWQSKSYWNVINCWIDKINRWLLDYDWDNPVEYINEKLKLTNWQMSIFDMEELLEWLDEFEPEDEKEKWIVEKTLEIENFVRELTSWFSSKAWTTLKYSRKKAELNWKKIEIAWRYNKYKTIWTKTWVVWQYEFHVLDEYWENSIFRVEWKNLLEVNSKFSPFLKQYFYN